MRSDQVDILQQPLLVVAEGREADYYIFGVGISRQLLRQATTRSWVPAGAGVGKVLKK